MKLDNIIRNMLPRDDKFFRLLEESTQNLLMSADSLRKLSTAKTPKKQIQIVEEYVRVTACLSAAWPC